MHSAHWLPIMSTGLAIFSMFFGAGNLMYPIKVGMISGQYTAVGMVGFLLTSVLLPLAGLMGIILFDGNYSSFFGRLGKRAGQIVTFLCLMILGPVIAIPRIVTLSHTMIAPFLPITILQEPSLASSFLFALLFLGITFLATFRENRIVSILGYVISPALLISLAIILVRGLWSAHTSTSTSLSAFSVFSSNVIMGYETLDLISALFFSSFVLQILKTTLGGTAGFTRRTIIHLGLKAGLLGVALLAIVYMGMSTLGLFHGLGLENVNAGELFRAVSFKILGGSGAFIISTTVLMACLSTSIALAAAVAEYIQRTLFQSRISYELSLILVLLACIPLSICGLDAVLSITAGPIIYVGYPVVICLTICNILYKLFEFKPVQIPVLVTFLVALASYVRG